MVRKNAVRLWAVVFWLVVWQLGSMAFGQTLLLPSPLAVLLRLASLAATVEFWSAVGWSAARILGGFALSCLAAVLLAVPAFRWRRIQELLSPLVAAVKTVVR